MAVINIDQNNFRNEVMHSTKPVLLDFWAAWCGPCCTIGPVLEQIAEERADIKVCKVNIDEQPELAKEFGIMSIPTLMVIKDGNVVNRSQGAKSKSAILKMI